MTPNTEAHRLELLCVLKNSTRDIEANRLGRLGAGPGTAAAARRRQFAAGHGRAVVVFAAIIVFVAARPIFALQWGLSGG